MNTFAHLLRESQRGERVGIIVFFLLVGLQTLFAPLDLAVYPNKMTVGLDKTVFIKLLVMGGVFLASCWAFVVHATVRRAMLSLPALMLTFLLLLTILGASSGLVRISPIVSFVNYVGIVFVVSAITVLGFRVFALAISCGVLVTAVWGLVLFYLDPASGVFTEPIADGEFLIRIGGLAHPNSVARSMILASLLVLYLWRAGDLHWASATPFLLFFGWNIVLAKSRTAIVAGVIAAGVLFIDLLRPKRMIVAGTLLSIFGLASVFALFATGNEDRFVGKLLGMVAKSGDTEELTTGTGRTEIWAETATFIAKRPLLGYGLNVGPVLLVDHSQATHNSVMYATLAAGLVGGLTMIVLQFWLLGIAIQSPMLVIRAVAAFLFLSCLTEDTVLETFPGPATMLWYACYLVPVLPVSVVMKGAEANMPTDA